MNYCDFATPKTVAKSEPGPAFPRIFSSESQVKAVRNVTSVTRKSRKQFIIYEKQREVTRNNQILLNKMLEIEKNPSFFAIGCKEGGKVRKVPERIKSKIKVIESGNAALQERLKNVKSCYNLGKFKDEYEKKTRKLNFSLSSDPKIKNHFRIMKDIDKMMQEELRRQANYKQMI